MSRGSPAPRATYAGVTKMPDPTIPPITISVAAKRPMRRDKPVGALGIRETVARAACPPARFPGAAHDPPCRGRERAAFWDSAHSAPSESERMPARQGSILIENVQPQVDCGRHPVKRAAGETVRVSADVLKEGHDELAVVLRWRQLTPK